MVELMLVIIKVREAMLVTNSGLNKLILYQYVIRTAKDLTNQLLIVEFHNMMELHNIMEFYNIMEFHHIMEFHNMMEFHHMMDSHHMMRYHDFII